MFKKLHLFVAICGLLTSTLVLGQSGIIGADFSTSWTNSSGILQMSASAGSSRIIIRNPAGTGNRFFRIVRDATIEMSPSAGCIGGQDSDVSANAGTQINVANTGQCGNGAWFINVSNASWRYVFKTPSNNATSFYWWAIQGTEQTVSSVTRNVVIAGAATTVTANLSGSLSTGQTPYLRYTTNNFSTSTVVTMTGSGSTYTADIPAGANVAGNNVIYYVFTGPSSGVNSDGSNADLFTFNLNNNGGSNFSYVVGAFEDTFNRSALNPGNNPSFTYSTNFVGGVTATLPTVSGTPALQIAHTTTQGIASVVGTTSSFGDGYNTTLSSNTAAIITWTFNMRFNRTTNPAGIAAGSYGQAVVLASSGSVPFGTGTTGYAVVYGNSGTPDPIRLVRFNAAALTDICTSGTSDISSVNNYVGVRVVYFPGTNQWQLFVRDDGASAWADPLTGVTAQKGSTTVDNTYTGTALTHFGYVWSHATTAGDNAQFDNFRVRLAQAVQPAVTGFTVSAPGSGSSGFVGNTVTITGSGFIGTNIVRFGGVGGTNALSFTVVDDNTITCTAPDAGGVIYVANGAGNASSSGSYTTLGYRTAATGGWNTAATWLHNAVPPNATTTVVTLAHNVTSTPTGTTNVASLTVNSGVTLTITAATSVIVNTASTNSGTITANGTLAVAATYTNSGTLTIGNGGTFQINQGGFLSGTAASYNATASTLAFNNSSGAYGVQNSHAYWPAANGPITVSAIGAGGVQLQTGTTRSVTNLLLSAGFEIQSAGLLTVTGNLQINTNGFMTVNAPIYGASSVLTYNTGSSFGISTEWTGNSNTAGTGVPNNVTIQGNTTLTFPTTNRGLAGNFTITSGSAATLNATSGDLLVGRNFVQNGTFTANGRAVFFNGTAAQDISGTGTIAFAYLIINNNSAAVTLSRSSSVTATVSDVLQLLGSGAFNIASGITLTISGNGGNILVNGGTRTINLNAATSFIDITGTKTVTSVASGTLNITSTASGSALRISAGVNFGNNLTTIGNNTFLIINNGGFADTNSPIYGSGSTLSFRTGATYTVGSGDRTWGPGTSGAGVPFNLEINLASTNVTVTDNRTVTNNVTITIGTLTNNTATIQVGPVGGGNKTFLLNSSLARLTNNGGTLNISGNLNMSAGNFDMNSGTINIDPNDGNAGTSVASGTDIFTVNSAINSSGVTGGTIIINDPPFSGTGRAFSYTGSSGNAFWSGNTMQFGGTTNLHSSTATNGFNVDTYVNTSNLQLGNVIANGGTGANRYLSGSTASGNGFDIGGNLTINTDSEVRTISGGTVLRIRGNIVNNGTLTDITGINFNNRAGTNINANTTAQTVSGSGTFRNALSSPDAKFSTLLFNNTATGNAITFNIGEVSLSGSVTWTAGVVNIGTANDWVFVGTATSTGTSGYLLRDATAAGFMKRTHATANSFTYRIGDGTVYSPIVLSFSTNSVSRQMGVSVADGKHPQMDNPVAAIDYLSRYWRIFENGQGGNYTFTAAMTYNQAGDAVGTETDIRAAGWDGTSWTAFLTGNINTSTSVLTSGAINQTNAPTLNNLVITGRLNPADVTPPAFSGFTALTNSCVTGNRTVSGITITDLTGISSTPTIATSSIRPRIYYRKNAGTWYSNGGTYVSGTVNSSVWDFTIVSADMGGLTGGDVVQYYLTAQDTASPTVNVGALPSAGFSATTVNSITNHPTTPNSYTVLYTLSGNYNVGTASAAPFNNLENAIATYNAGCLAGAVTFSLTDASYTPATALTINNHPDASATNTLTIKPTQSATTISGTFTPAIFVLNGADYVILDGSTGSTANTVCPASAASRNLTITNNSTSTSSAVVWLQTTAGSNAATNNIIRNCVLTGNANTTTFAGIGSGSTTVGITSTGTANNNNAFVNNDIRRAQVGIFTRGNSAGNKNSGTVIQQNLINSAAPDNTYRAGIYAGFESGINITGNAIANVNTAGGGSNDGFGITLGASAVSATAYAGDEVTGATITNNTINLIRGGSATSAVGLYVAPAASGTTLIANNMIGNIAGNGSGGDIASGIWLGGGSGSTTNVFYNTVFTNIGTIFNNTGRINGISIGGSNPVVNLRNNIFNTTVGTIATGQAVRAITLDYTSYTNLTSNNNAFFASGGNSTQVAFAQVGGLGSGGTNVANFSDWQTSTGGDANSFVQQATVVSGTDLHLQIIPANLPFDGTGAVVSVTTDIDCANRTGIDSPDIGADEFTRPTCSGTPTPGTASATPAGPYCGEANTTISITGASFAYGITYQWQQSISGNPGTFTNINAATNPTLVLTGLGSSNNYRCLVTCTNSSLSDSTNVVSIVVNPAPTVTVTPTISTLCGSGSTVLTASGATTYTWAPAAGLSATTGSSVTASPTVSTTYVVTGTTGGCSGTASTTVNYSPAIPTVAPTATPNPICDGGTVNLGVSMSNTTLTVFQEGFNEPANNWTLTNNSTGGTDPELARWTLRPSGYTYSSVTFTTADASQFYLSNSDEQGLGGTTTTILRSPAFSTLGISTATLSLNHFYRFNGSESATVQASTDGTNWTTLVTYTSTQGSATNFASPNISMNAFANQPVVYIRFRYDATYDWYWAINSVSVSGNAIYNYAWTSTPSGFTSSAQNPSASPISGTTYNLTVSNVIGCTGSGNVAVTVTPIPVVNAGTPMTTCGTSAFTFNSGATNQNTTGLSWTTTGGGTFTNTSTLTPTYTPLVGEIGSTISFTLTGTGGAPCSNAVSTVTLQVLPLNLYYPDADGDGFGNVFGSPISACTPPPGYVNNNSDPCDTNGNVNPLTEWWADMDGDGFGGFIYITGIVSGCSGFPGTIPYFPGVNGNQPYPIDCNDNNPNVFPGAAEICQNGIDENCNGMADDGCSFIPNDNWNDAQNISFNAFPQCVWIAGTVLNAAISPQGNPANVAVGGGRDVWYRFTAQSTGVSIKVAPTGFDAVIELQTSAATEINVENVVGSGAQEILNFNGLTVGQQYWIGVRNFNNNAGGAFNICVSPLMPTNCSSNGSTLDLCTNYKPNWTGASNYTFTFTGTGATPVGPIVATAPSQVAMAGIGLRYGGTYDVSIAANYQLVNGAGTPENITIASINTCPLTINPHAVVEVKPTQLCPATVLRGSFLQAKPFVCGATNFTVAFRRVTNCTGNVYIDPAPFEVTTSGASSTLNLSFTSPQPLIPQNWYEVRWRPNFAYGNGSYGPPRIIFIGGSAMEELENTFGIEKKLNATVEAMLYPNPNDGTEVNLRVDGPNNHSVFVRILDAMGRVVYTNRYSADGVLLTQMTFVNALAPGLYMVELSTDDGITTERMLVER